MVWHTYGRVKERVLEFYKLYKVKYKIKEAKYIINNLNSNINNEELLISIKTGKNTKKIKLIKHTKEKRVTKDVKKAPKCTPGSTLD